MPVVKPSWWTSDHWGTPPAVVRGLEMEFGSFDLDPCCLEQTSKAVRFFSPPKDGLAESWHGRVFLNPPYSKPGPWLQKAIYEIASGRAQIVVALLPVRTDTRWFHDYVLPIAELRFIKGRIKWIGWQGTPIPSPKEPNMFAIYRPVVSETSFKSVPGWRGGRAA